MFNWFFKGGPVMIPIIILSVASSILIIERFKYLKKMAYNTDEFMNSLEQFIKKNKKTDAIHYCQKTPGPIAKMMNAGFSVVSKGKEVIKETIHEVVLEEIPKLEKNLSTISILASISPMLGLLGTVIGMIRSFNVIALQGTGDPQALAGGISEALITTEAGLIIAIPLLFLYNMLSDRVNKLTTEMERSSIKFINQMVNNNGK